VAQFWGDDVSLGEAGRRDRAYFDKEPDRVLAFPKAPSWKVAGCTRALLPRQHVPQLEMCNRQLHGSGCGFLFELK